jgi:hypothetical protein
MVKEIKLSRVERIGNRFGIQRKNAKAEANAIIQNSASSDFKDLKLLVEGQETQWKSSHGAVSQCPIRTSYLVVDQRW